LGVLKGGYMGVGVVGVRRVERGWEKVYQEQ
jgi:hypothetical protein